MNPEKNREWFLRGLRHGIPIAAGYFSVAFALGISAKNAGLNVFQASLTSLLCNTSSGEYAGFTVMGSDASYLTMALITLIVCGRYLLMSVSLSQKLPEETSLKHRLMVGFWITDEIYGASSTVPGKLNPFYNYGLAICSLSFWVLGTGLGVAAGNVLPANIVSALSVLLYGMFLAIIIPPARGNRVIGCLVLLSMSLSFACSKLPYISDLTEGTRIIILTIIIALAASILFPVKDEDMDGQEEAEDANHET